MTRHLRADPGQTVGSKWFTKDELVEPYLSNVRPLLEPRPATGYVGVLVTGDDGGVYWMSITEPADPLPDGSPDIHGMTVTLREVHTTDERELARGPVVSRKVTSAVDLFGMATEAILNEEFGPDADEAEVNARYQAISDEEIIPRLKDARAEALIRMAGEALALVGVVWPEPEEGGTTTIIGPGGGRKEREVPSVGEALNEAWPHDGWSGTAKEAHGLVGGEDGDYTLDAVKKALQRGDYESTETPGQASSWRRVPRRR